MPPDNGEWLALLSNLSDLAWFFESQDSICHADTIRTAIDLLKYFNPNCHSTKSEFEWANEIRATDTTLEIEDGEE